MENLQHLFGLVQHALDMRIKNRVGRLQSLKDVREHSCSFASYQEMAIMCNHLDSNAIEKAKELVGIVTLYISCSNPLLQKPVTALWN